jgi:CRISPR-associated protein Csm3
MRLEKISEISGEIEIVTGLHIGAGDLEMRIGGVDNAVIRNPGTGEPYIPGSSLKGKIRSLLEWRSGAVQSSPLSLKDLKQHENAPEGKEILAILQLFGVSGDTDRSDEEAGRVGPTRVSFSDAALMTEQYGSNQPITEIKSETP